MRKPSLRFGLTVALAALAATQAGCALVQQQFLAAIQAGENRAASPSGPSFADLGLKAENSVEIQTAGILAKHSSKFSGTVTAPQGILAKHSSKYRVQAYRESPVADITVLLMTPDERVLSSGGRPAAVKTDASGKFDFGEFAVAPGTEVLVQARAEDPIRVIISFMKSAEGSNAVHLNLASNYVYRLLLHESRRVGKSMSDFSPSKLAAILGQTHTMLERGDLAPTAYDLVTGREFPLKDSYIRAMSGRYPDLLGAWRELLGSDPVLFEAGPVETEPGSSEQQEGI